MSIVSKPPRLADQFCARGRCDNLAEVENEVMPRVLAALRRRFGHRRALA